MRLVGDIHNCNTNQVCLPQFTSLEVAAFTLANGNRGAPTVTIRIGILHKVTLKMSLLSSVLNQVQVPQALLKTHPAFLRVMSTVLVARGDRLPCSTNERAVNHDMLTQRIFRWSPQSRKAPALFRVRNQLDKCRKLVPAKSEIGNPMNLDAARSRANDHRPLVVKTEAAAGAVAEVEAEVEAGVRTRIEAQVEAKQGVVVEVQTIL